MTLRPLAAGLALALTMSALPATAASGDAATRLDAVVVTATRALSALPIELAASTVLDRAAIERSQAPDLIDLLARQPGIDVSRTGGPGAVSTLFLRGANSNHTLVLIDGVRVNSAQQGLYDFAHLPLERIERIEIVRGPRAALWGSDAIGGVIQIFTRDPSGSSLQLRAGSFERVEAAAHWGRTTATGALGLGAGVIESDGFNASTPRNFSFDPDADGHRNRHLGLAGQRQIGSQRLEGRLLVTAARVEFDRGHTDADGISGGLSLGGRLADGWHQQLALGHGSETLDTHSAFGSRFESRRDSLDWLHELDLAAGQTLLFGINHVREQARAANAAATTIYDRDRRNTGLVGAWRGLANDWQWDLAFRHDDNSQFGSTRTAQAALGRSLGDGWQLRGSWGQGFRAPSTNELYSPGFGGFFAGNPALAPERSHTLEAGLEWQGETANLGLSAYRGTVSDLITFAGPRWQAINVQQARLQGVELEGRQRQGRLTLQGHLGWQRAENARSGAQLLRRAPRKAALGLELAANDWLDLGLDVLAVARRQDFDGPLGGYARLDLRTQARLGAGWVLRGRIENLLDRNYTLASGFATPGQSVLLELSRTEATRP